MQAKRINDIELREINGKWEIVVWYPNPNYGKESEFTYDEVKGMYLNVSKFGLKYYVPKETFTTKEHCYVVAWVKNIEDEEPDIETVGARPFQLRHRQRVDMYKLLNYIYNDIHI